jgi:hypothetical protein
MTIIQAIKLGEAGEQIQESIKCIRYAQKFNQTIEEVPFVENSETDWSKSEYIEMNLEIIEQNLLKL